MEINRTCSKGVRWLFRSTLIDWRGEQETVDIFLDNVLKDDLTFLGFQVQGNTLEDGDNYHSGGNRGGFL